MKHTLHFALGKIYMLSERKQKKKNKQTNKEMKKQINKKKHLFQFLTPFS